MAQRLIHLLMAERLFDDRITDRNRFMLGHLLPDAYGDAGAIGQSRFEAQSATHFTRTVNNGEWRYFDFAAFWRRFRDEICADDLYLGYYMHVFEDACYRLYMHVDCNMPRMTFDRVKIMHADYHLLNAYIMKKYRLSGDICVPADFDKERIFELYPFAIAPFLVELEQDMNEHPEGETHFMTEARLDEFTDRYIPLCAEAMEKARRGEEPPDPNGFGWGLKDE